MGQRTLRGSGLERERDTMWVTCQISPASPGAVPGPGQPAGVRDMELESARPEAAVWWLTAEPVKPSEIQSSSPEAGKLSYAPLDKKPFWCVRRDAFRYK